MRYLIVEKTEGLFLGVFYNTLWFAKENPWPAVKAPSFATEKEAMSFIARSLPKDDGQKYGVISVDAKERYVDIVDIIKAGYSEFTHELMDNIPMISKEIH